MRIFPLRHGEKQEDEASLLKNLSKFNANKFIQKMKKY